MLGWNYLLFEALKGFSVGICDGRFIYGKIFFFDYSNSFTFLCFKTSLIPLLKFHKATVLEASCIEMHLN
jgi:hypothetical protein